MFDLYHMHTSGEINLRMFVGHLASSSSPIFFCTSVYWYVFLQFIENKWKWNNYLFQIRTIWLLWTKYQDKTIGWNMSNIITILSFSMLEKYSCPIRVQDNHPQSINNWRWKQNIHWVSKESFWKVSHEVWTEWIQYNSQQ